MCETTINYNMFIADIKVECRWSCFERLNLR